MAPSAISEQPAGNEIKMKSKPAKEETEHVHGAEDMTPLQAISHHWKETGLVIGGIPKFSTFQAEREHILIHTAAIFRFFSRSNFTEGMSGHISVRDPEYPSAIWMNPLGKHFGLMTAGDLICLDVNTGAVIGGNRSRPGNSAGFLIHSEIHKARPDVHAVAHAHTIAGRAWSAFAKPLDMLHQDICYLYDSHAVYADYGGIVFAEEEGRNIAKALGKKNKAAILMNHGLLSVGSTVDETGFLFGLLDRSCKIQLQVEAACAGNPELKKKVVSDAEAAYVFKMASDKDTLYAEAQPDVDYEIEMAGLEVIAKGVENQKIDASFTKVL